MQASAGEQNRVSFRNVSPTVSSKIFRILESEVIALTESYMRHASQVKRGFSYLRGCHHRDSEHVPEVKKDQPQM